MGNKLEENTKTKLIDYFAEIVKEFEKSYMLKTIALIKHLPNICRLHQLSLDNRKLRSEQPSKFHPIRPLRGEIFNALITENIGSELCGNHLVIIISNDTGNIYAEKVNVLPIEGDGNKINPNYQMQLSNSDLEWGNLDKNPSRIIFTDILTIDKARLDIRVGKVKNEKMKDIAKKLHKQLNL